MPAQLCPISTNDHASAKPALQSTIDLLESELVKARATLHDIQPNAIAAYRENLIARAPDFFYGSRRLTPKDVGLVPVARDLPDENTRFGSTQSTVPPKQFSRVTLVDLLSNTVILDRIAPYLSASSLLSLASTSQLFHSMVMGTPYVFRHLDLTRCHGAQAADVPPLVDSGQVPMGECYDQSMTEDEYYSAPLGRIFGSLERRSILQDVRTLILDGLSVPADLVAEIVLTDRFNVSILSIRECLHLNERKLIQVLQHAVRPTRPKGMPRVKGIYHFTPVKPGPMSRSSYRDWWSSRCTGNDDAIPIPENKKVPAHCQNAWYGSSGKLLKGSIEDGWAQALQKCEGIIAFDAILCRGPRHNVDLYSSSNKDAQPEGRLLGPAIATVAIGPGGCDGCYSSPEGPATWGLSPEERFPLLAPPPLHSSAPVAAKCPALFPNPHPVLNARCTECLTDRWCHRCNKWFCDNCLPRPDRVESHLSPHQTAVRGRRESHSSSDRMVRTETLAGVRLTDIFIRNLGPA